MFNDAWKKGKSVLPSTFTKKVKKEELNAQDILHGTPKLILIFGKTIDLFLSGFNTLSKHIRQNHTAAKVGNPLIIVVAGGACSVSMLQNRTSTRDIDFFSLDPNVIEQVFDAKHAASAELQVFPSDWINAEMIAWVLNHRGCEGLFDESVRMAISKTGRAREGTTYPCIVHI
jgi:hypothetical protein